MPEPHERLEQLAAAASWPPTPDLATTVRAAIAAAPAVPPAPARRARWRRPRRPLLAALLALAVGGGVLATPGAGSELLERLGLRGASVTQVRTLPRAAVGTRLALGARTSLAGARRAAGYPLVSPAALGPPAEVYADGDAVTFVYRAASGRPMLFTQVPGTTQGRIEKLVTQRTRRVRIGGRPGLLLRGRHVVLFHRSGGGTIVSQPRLAKTTLLWARGRLLLRLEADQPDRELLRIARSVG